MSEFLSIEEFLGSSDLNEKVFESLVWNRGKDAEGKIIPGRIKYRSATVGDREKARQAAKVGEKFDNAAYGCKLVSLCVIEPKIPEIDVDRLKQKNGKEMDRLLSLIIGDSEESPK